jgi:hypothetical protein
MGMSHLKIIRTAEYMMIKGYDKNFPEPEAPHHVKEWTLSSTLLLISTPDRGEWSALHSNCLSPRQSVPTVD